MPTATTARMIARGTKDSSATSLSAITMISADRMKSVRIAPPTIDASCSAPISPLSVATGRVVLVAAQPLPDLLGALVAEVGAAAHQQRREEPGQELAEQQGRGEDEQELVAQRPAGDLPDDRQLALGRHVLDVLRGDGGVVHDHAGGLRAGAAGRRTDVVHRRGGEPGEGGDVVEQAEEACAHSLRSCIPTMAGRLAGSVLVEVLADPDVLLGDGHVDGLADLALGQAERVDEVLQPGGERPPGQEQGETHRGDADQDERRDRVRAPPSRAARRTRRPGPRTRGAGRPPA